jgi:hypothetical protein
MSKEAGGTRDQERVAGNLHRYTARAKSDVSSVVVEER